MSLPGIIIAFIIYALILYLISKLLKFEKASILVSFEIALIVSIIFYFLQYFLYAGSSVVCFILSLFFIKYFYKVNIKKTIIIWLLSSIISYIISLFLLAFVGGIFSYDFFRDKSKIEQTKKTTSETVLENKYSNLKNYWQYIPKVDLGGEAFLYEITTQKENADPFREVKTTKGIEKVSVIFGIRMIYKYKDADESIKIHVEKSDKDEFASDKIKATDQFRYFIKTDNLRDDGENANLKEYKGYEYIYIENTNLSHSPINMAVIFFPEDQIIETIYFLNKKSNEIKLQTIQDLIDYKVNFKK